MHVLIIKLVLNFGILAKVTSIWCRKDEGELEHQYFV